MKAQKPVCSFLRHYDFSGACNSNIQLPIGDPIGFKLPPIANLVNSTLYCSPHLIVHNLLDNISASLIFLFVGGGGGCLQNRNSPLYNRLNLTSLTLVFFLRFFIR